MPERAFSLVERLCPSRLFNKQSARLRLERVDERSSYGRGTGVGRGRATGVLLGVSVGLGVDVAVVVAVAVAVGVDVNVAVAVAVAVGVGVGDVVAVGVGDGVVPVCTSNDPTSIRPLRTRQKTGPRWS